MNQASLENRTCWNSLDWLYYAIDPIKQLQVYVYVYLDWLTAFVGDLENRFCAGAAGLVAVIPLK
jgi:hypothetical protein